MWKKASAWNGLAFKNWLLWLDPYFFDPFFFQNKDETKTRSQGVPRNSKYDLGNSETPKYSQEWFWETWDPQILAHMIARYLRLSTYMQVWFCEIGDSHLFVSMILWELMHSHTSGTIVGSIRLLHRNKYDLCKQEVLTRTGGYSRGWSNLVRLSQVQYFQAGNSYTLARVIAGHTRQSISPCAQNLCRFGGFLWSPWREYRIGNFFCKTLWSILDGDDLLEMKSRQAAPQRSTLTISTGTFNVDDLRTNVPRWWSLFERLILTIFKQMLYVDDCYPDLGAHFSTILVCGSLHFQW